MVLDELLLLKFNNIPQFHQEMQVLMRQERRSNKLQYIWTANIWFASLNYYVSELSL